MAIERSNKGMLPRLRGVEIKESDEELVLLLADQFYPNLTHIDQIENPQEKRGWTILAIQILLGQKTIMRYVEKFGEIFRPGIEAQARDTIRKGAAEELERQEREGREVEMHKTNLFLLAQQGILDSERWDVEKKEREKKLELEEEERRTRTRNRDRREKMVMGMATIIFACAFVAFIIGLVSGEPWIIGTSSVTGIGALVAAAKLLSNENNPPGSSKGPPDSTAS